MNISLVGDVMLGRLVNNCLRVQPAVYPWGDTLSCFAASDLRICNLECVISNRGYPWRRTPKVFHFRSDAKNVAVLKEAGIDLVSLANNHTLDFEEIALSDTLAILNNTGISHTGAGLTLNEARHPAVINKEGVTVGMIAFTDNEPSWCASQKRPGTFYVPVDLQNSWAKDLFKRVAQTKSEVDFLIVSAHWGGNWGYSPPLEHILFAHKLIDEGADLVYGHSAHVFRGIEIYHDHPIFYSAGDFIDDYAIDPEERNDQSFIFQLSFKAGIKGGKITLIPTVISHFQAIRAKKSQAIEIAAKMHSLCEDLGCEAQWQEQTETLVILW